MNYKIDIIKYGFYISFEIEKFYSGFYWRASNDIDEQIGQINFNLCNKNSYLQIETSFTPTKVDIFPIFSASKVINISPSYLYPGNWTLKFVNLKKSSSALQILGVREGSYEGTLLLSDVFLEDEKSYMFDIKINNIFDKLFFKKCNYAESSIQLFDIILINRDKNKTFISDESLVKLEYDCISRVDNRIIFEDKAPIWSFFSIQFYEI